MEINLNKLDKDELIQQIQIRNSLFKDMINKTTLINQALAGIYAKTEISKDDLQYPLDALAKAIEENVEAYNLLIDDLVKKTSV